ncbi:MAG: carbon-nitrogen hydrolase [Deltaproteobacteria bacterium]|nr:carbon-nitrogen hydrolase [Deltaproteobacteria bacterium]
MYCFLSLLVRIVTERCRSLVKTKITVGIAQINPRLGDLQANFSLCERSIHQAREKGLDLLVFPELSLTGYHLRDMVATVALRADAPEMARLKELSREVPLVVGLVEESPDYRFYNAAVYLAEGEIRHLHRKVYLPTYGMFDEQRYFARGHQIRAFDLPFGRASLLICEDLWHPSTAYLAALDRALLIICPSSSPLRGISDGETQDDNARYWELMNRAYAETFSVFLVYANRVGFEDGVGFWGGSEILDPFGRRLAKGRYYEEDFITAELSLDTVRRKRVASPLLRDEDIDLTINELLRIRGR